MTSDGDELEEALRQNLKLRRDLAANIAKTEAASQQGGTGYRLGRVLYWACLALIGLYATFWVVVSQDASWNSIILKDWSTVFVLALPIIALYALGRALRYVLSGE
jgi:hypothetical protein